MCPRLMLLSSLARPRLSVGTSVQPLRSLARCITGPIREQLADPDSCNAGTITICDSIVTSIDPAEPAIRTTLGHVHLDRSTVVGRVEVARLYASDSIVDGRITVTDNQHGCFRYSATGAYGDTAVLPSQFEALVVPGSLPGHWLSSRRFGDAWFGALSETAPQTLTWNGGSQTYDSLITEMTKCPEAPVPLADYDIDDPDNGHPHFKLAFPCNPNDINSTARTRQIVKALCAAAVGSAAMLIQ